MGNYYEGRARACWVCKYFLQNDENYRNGICCRNAPEKIDENLGTGVTGAPAGFDIFANIIDPETGFCNEFVPYETAPPAVIPPILPPA